MTIVQSDLGVMSGVSRFPTDFHYSNPVATDDAIYFSLSVGDGFLFAVDAKTGEEKRTLKLKNTKVSPVAIAGDQIFIGTSDGSFRSLNRQTGKINWQIGRKDYRFDLISPVVSDGLLLFAGFEEVFPRDATLHALDALTGRQVWMIKVKGIASSPAVNAETVYFGDMESHLLAVDIRTGKEKWRLKTEGNVYTRAVARNRIYFAASGDLCAADMVTGQLLWKATKANKVGTVLAFDNGLVYYGGRDGFVYAVDGTSGHETWRFKVGDPCSAPVIAGDVLYFVSSNKTLYALDSAAGSLKWKYRWQEELSSSPVITSDTIYLLDEAGYLSALR